MRIGLLQALPVPWDLEANMETLESMAYEASRNGVELLVTCECFLDGYCVDRMGIKERFTGALRERFEGVAQPGDSPLLRRAGSIAKRFHLGMVLGATTLEAGCIYNTAILLNINGDEIGRYHKTHLYEQDLNYTAGNGFPVFNSPWGKIGLLICADRRWPEAARTLRCQGAEIIIIPTYGMRHEANTCWMRTRAYENECFLAFCHPRSAFVCNPDGDVEAHLESNVPSVLVHDVDLQKCKTEMIDMRRVDLY